MRSWIHILHIFAAPLPACTHTPYRRVPLVATPWLSRGDPCTPPTGHTPRGRRRLPTLLRARHTQALARTRTCTCTPRPSHLAHTYTCTTCLPCHLTCLHVTLIHRAPPTPTHRALLTPTHLHNPALTHTSSTCTQPPPACLYPVEAVLRAGARVLGKSLAAVPCSRSRAPIDESRPSEHCISNIA